jgi:CheY-like chemotaxis protein
MLPESGKPFILYIEDDIEDVELLMHVLQHLNCDIEIVHMSDGIKALEFLEQSKQYRLMPEMILLDINMSKLNGKETFVCLQADKTFARIPVVVLSTSNLPEDINYFKKFSIPYIIKPGEINRFKEELSVVLEKLLVC